MLFPLIFLTGCVTSREVAVAPSAIPQVPARLRACFANNGYTLPKGDLPGGDMSVTLAVKVIGELQSDNRIKTACGRQLLRFADDVRSKVGGVK